MEKISFDFGSSRSVLIMLALTLASVAPVFGDGPAIRPDRVSPAATETGLASYYGTKYHGRPTASGEVFNMHELTAAHPWLAFGTRVKVTHLANHQSVTVRINDRGPFVKGRVIDLSQAAANELRMVKSGLAVVKIEIVEQAGHPPLPSWRRELRPTQKRGTHPLELFADVAWDK